MFFFIKNNLLILHSRSDRGGEIEILRRWKNEVRDSLKLDFPWKNKLKKYSKKFLVLIKTSLSFASAFNEKAAETKGWGKRNTETI